MIDVNKYLNNKLDVDFVNELNIENRIGTIVSAEEVTIDDNHTKKQKPLIELKVDFAKLGEIRTILPNQKSLKNLKDFFEEANVEKWVGKQIIPKTHVFPNKMVGVLLEGAK